MSVKEILQTGETIAFPGVYDALSALLAQQAGFPFAFVSGYAVAATMLGEPDIGLLTQTEMIQRARQICRRVRIPILVDADTGYGNPLNVYRTVSELIEAGAAGCFLEDQVWPKRCGHMQGKQVIDRSDYIQKIRAAVQARQNHEFFIVARTDALAVNGLDSAIERVTAAREAGANASFIEAPGSLDELEEIGRRSPRPNVANMIEGGHTPVLPKDKLKQLGFDLVLYPLAGLFGAAKTLQDIYGELMRHGSTDSFSQTGDAAKRERLLKFEQFNDLIGVIEKRQLEKQFES